MRVDKQNKRSPWQLQFFCFLFIVAVFVGSSIERNSVWQDPISLWEDTAQKSPRTGGVYLNLGLAYHKKKQIAKALENYYKVIRLGSASTIDAYNNIGSIYVDLGEYDKAVQIFSKLLLYDQNNATIYASRGHAYYRQGRYDNAIQDFSKSLLLAQYNPEVHLYRGMSHEKKGDRPAALRDFKTACALGEARACEKIPLYENR